MESMIHIKKMRKMFGTFVAVENVSFSVAKGEVLGFLGPNGAGKSTTMKMACGFLTPTDGTAVICGHDILQHPIEAKKKLGYLPEGAPAYPEMTPAGFLKFIAEIRGYRGAEAQRRVDQAVARTSLESHLYVPIEALSKGFKRRVGLAQAILHDPPVLVMDEPTDGLDPNQKFEVRKLIKEMAEEKAIILSTHILEEVEAVCTRAVIIAAGKVIADGTPQELAARAPGHHAVDIVLKRDSAKDARERLGKLVGVRRVDDLAGSNGSVGYRVIPDKGVPSVLASVAQCARDNGWHVETIRQEEGRLEDVFRDLTREATAKAGRET